MRYAQCLKVNFGLARRADFHGPPGPVIDKPRSLVPSEGYRVEARHQAPRRGGGMDFLGMPDVSPHVFFGLTAASLVTSFLGISTGAAGGLLLLALMASVLPPSVLLPI